MNPLVSCIMPTRNRAEWLPAAIDCWVRQTYQHKELIIFDDSDDVGKLAASGTPSIFPLPPRVYLYTRADRTPLGAKRNFCCRAALGRFICHWDDDDWSAPDRITYQVARIMTKEKPITGFGTLPFWDVENKTVRVFHRSDGYVCGTTLLYLREAWEKSPFPEDQNVNEDNAFIYGNFKHITASGKSDLMVGRIHGQHTSTKENIKPVPGYELPAAFWENEQLRLGR